MSETVLYNPRYLAGIFFAKIEIPPAKPSESTPKINPEIHPVRFKNYQLRDILLSCLSRENCYIVLRASSWVG